MKLEEFQQLGKNVKYIATKFAENPGKFASVVLQMYWDVEKERDAYKRQRDELINDMAEIKRKAEAFDEIKVELKRKFDIESKRLRRANRNLKDNASKEYIIGKITGQNVELINIMTTISDLERGSDE